MFRKILVATDLSPCSEPALRAALELGRESNATVIALHVAEPPYESGPWSATLSVQETELYRTIVDREQEHARTLIGEQVRRVVGAQPADRPPELFVVDGIPADAILDTARSVGADLIVVGTHGRRGLKHALLGSIAERVVRTAPVPVLTIRSTER